MQRDQVDRIICWLIAIKEFSKDIHYTCHGDAFYSKHLLVDKFDWDDHIDLLKECCLLGNDERPSPSINYLKMTANQFLVVPEEGDKKNFEILLKMINNALNVIDNASSLTAGDANVIGGIAQDLQQYKGLVNLQVE